MSGLESLWESYWWIFPLIAILLCFLGMRGRRGAWCCFRSSDTGYYRQSPTDSALDILDKRFALGEISRKEYEERKREIVGK